LTPTEVDMVRAGGRGRAGASVRVERVQWLVVRGDDG